VENQKQSNYVFSLFLTTGLAYSCSSVIFLLLFEIGLLATLIEVEGITPIIDREVEGWEPN